MTVATLETPMFRKSCASFKRKLFCKLLSFRDSPTSASQNVVDGNGTSSEKDQRKSKGGGREGEFVARATWAAHQTIVQMYFPDGNREVDKNSEHRSTREES